MAGRFAPARRRAGNRRLLADGTTLLELMVTAVVLVILASAALPIASASHRREKEIRLRRALREIRLALDTYHVVCRQSLSPTAAAPTDPTKPGQVQQLRIKVEDDPDQTCYPKELEVLVEGVETNVPRYRLRFLRRIPSDPFNTTEAEHDDWGWRLRSTTGRPGSETWNRRNVFDVYSGSETRALDGSYYKDW